MMMFATILGTVTLGGVVLDILFHRQRVAPVSTGSLTVDLSRRNLLR